MRMLLNPSDEGHFINNLTMLLVIDVNTLMPSGSAQTIGDANRNLLNELKSLPHVYIVIVSPFEIAETVGLVGIDVGLVYVGQGNATRSYGPPRPGDPIQEFAITPSDYSLLHNLVGQYHAHSLTVIGSKRVEGLFEAVEQLHSDLTYQGYNFSTMEVGCVPAFSSRAWTRNHSISLTVKPGQINQLLGEIYVIYRPSENQ